MGEFDNKYTNFEGLKEETLGNAMIYKKLIQLFITLVDEYINMFDADLENLDQSTLYSVTHKIIPSIRMFGITELEPILIKLEKEYRKEIEIASIKEDLHKSLQIFKQVKLELDHELKSL